VTSSAAWPTPLEGHVVAGTYADVLAHLRDRLLEPKAAVALFAQASGMEAFLAECHRLLGTTPMVGGAAARGAGQTCGELLPAAAEVSMLLITKGTWTVKTLNVHDATATKLEFRSSEPRTITHLRHQSSGGWRSAAMVFRALQTEYSCSSADCESITICDSQGRNMHVSFAGEWLHTGADLPIAGSLVIRIVTRSDASQRLAAFCSVPSALVFACAGLRRLIDMPIEVAPGTLVGFMFGELVTLVGRPQFGNLMAAGLVPAEGDHKELPAPMLLDNL
jgi:hypothetical protein